MVGKGKGDANQHSPDDNLERPQSSVQKPSPAILKPTAVSQCASQAGLLLVLMQAEAGSKKSPDANKSTTAVHIQAILGHQRALPHLPGDAQRQQEHDGKEHHIAKADSQDSSFAHAGAVSSNTISQTSLQDRNM